MKTMTHRERTLAVLRYQPYDRLPIVHFGYWGETLAKWVNEGHLRQDEVTGYADGNAMDVNIAAKLGFDFNWQSMFYTNGGLDPAFERLKPLVELGGYIPCPDHRIAPDAKWDNVRYYCDRMRKVFEI